MRRATETHDLLSVENARTDRSFPVMRTLPDGTQRIQEVKEPFTQPGAIVSADGDRITQSIGRGHTFTYRTEDVLRNPQTAPAQLRVLENAAANHESLTIAITPRATDLAHAGQELDRGRDLGR